MATGYTDEVRSGKVTSFRLFALKCSRAFGALIHMRDDDLDAEIRPREESNFYEDLLKTSTARLHELLSMTVDQAKVLAEAEREKNVAYRKESAATRRVEWERYRAMRAKVEQWKPPTAEHDSLKKFMLEQIDKSIEFDCSERITEFEPPVEPVDPRAWLTGQIDQERKNLERYAGEVAKEKERVRGANEWMRQLAESLPTEES